MPVEDAVGMSCAMAIAMVVLSLFGYLIFLLVKLVVEGFKALNRKEWGKALGYLAVPGIPVLLMFVLLVGTGVSQAAQETARKQAQEALRQEYERFSTDFPSMVDLTNVKRYLSGPLDTWGYVGFVITNRTDETVRFETTNVDGRLGCWFSWGSEEPNYFIEGGETLGLGCEDFSTQWSDETSQLEPEEGVVLLEELCIRFTSGESFGEYGNAQFEVCEPIK